MTSGPPAAPRPTSHPLRKVSARKSSRTPFCNLEHRRGSVRNQLWRPEAPPVRIPRHHAGNSPYRPCHPQSRNSRQSRHAVRRPRWRLRKAGTVHQAPLAREPDRTPPGGQSWISTRRHLLRGTRQRSAARWRRRPHPRGTGSNQAQATGRVWAPLWVAGRWEPPFGEAMLAMAWPLPRRRRSSPPRRAMPLPPQESRPSHFA